jgi:hypothetical protein
MKKVEMAPEFSNNDGKLKIFWETSMMIFLKIAG